MLLFFTFYFHYYKKSKNIYIFPRFCFQFPKKMDGRLGTRIVPKQPFLFSETEIKKLAFNTFFTLFLEIEIKKLEVKNSLILIFQKWSKSRRKLFTQSCLNNYQIVGVKTLLFIVLTWLVWNLAKWKKEIHASSVHFSESLF